MSAQVRLRGTAGIGLLVLVVAGCSASTSPAPSAGTSASPIDSATSSAGATAAPTATAATPPATPAPTATAVPATPAPTGTWDAAGTLPETTYGRTVVALGAAGALAIAGDGLSVARWEPGSAGWRKVAPLNADRQDYAAVTLPDGRVLVAGGVDTHDWEHWRSYSSAYVFDGSAPDGTWTKTGLMGSARTAPAAALLPDGRVLVAGGAYMDGPPWGASVGDVTLAVARPGAGRAGRRLDDMAPPNVGKALATTEIFDPASGQWSSAASMAYARVGAKAVTLADGRILIVGPSSSITGGLTAAMDPRAFATDEIYDPATGRFTTVGGFPPIDRAAVAADGVTLPSGDVVYTDVGTLVPLADGGAFLVGHVDSWKNEGQVSRNLRFDAKTGTWSQVGPAWASATDWSGDAPTWSNTPGTDDSSAFAGILPGGQVLVAGGGTVDPETKDYHAVATAQAWDPVTGGWADLSPMPQARNGGTTGVLRDGSIVVAGGDWAQDGTETAIRFVPGG